MAPTGLLHRAINGLSSAAAILSGIAVVLLALLIGFDVIARHFFGVSVQGTDELGGYTLALIGSLGLTYALTTRSHTRIDIALPLLPARGRAWAHALAYATLAAFAIFITRHAGSAFLESWEFDSTANTPLQTPMWVPQGLWVVGTALFAATTVLYALDALRLAFSDPTTANQRYGPKTTTEELESFVKERQLADAEAPRLD